MSFDFKPATRQGIKPLICAYGESNSGKTYSMLLLARGIAGPNGKILMGDTESGRGALYADEIPGGYLRTDFEPPFSPERYMRFLDEAEALHPDVIVLDSFTHEWSGEGGVLDIAGENEAGGKKGLAVWKAPKMAHAKLVMRLLRSKTFVIVGLRAKFKSRQVKNQKGFTEIVKDDRITPIQDDEFLFEATAHMEMQTANPGTIRLTKWSVAGLQRCFPKDGTEKIGIAHGTAIAAWASNPGSAFQPPTQGGQKKSLPSAEKMRERIIQIADQSNIAAADLPQFLWDEGIISDTEVFDDLLPERLLQVGEKLKLKLGVR
jgi:hypothetical protein